MMTDVIIVMQRQRWWFSDGDGDDDDDDADGDNNAELSGSWPRSWDTWMLFFDVVMLELLVVTALQNRNAGVLPKNSE